MPAACRLSAALYRSPKLAPCEVSRWRRFALDATYIASTVPRAGGARFITEIHRYVWMEKTHYANAKPAVPAALATLLVGSWRPAHFQSRNPGASAFNPAASSPVLHGNHFLRRMISPPSTDLKTLYRAAFDATGQTIAVVGQTALSLSDAIPPAALRPCRQASPGGAGAGSLDPNHPRQSNEAILDLGMGRAGGSERPLDRRKRLPLILTP